MTVEDESGKMESQGVILVAYMSRGREKRANNVMVGLLLMHTTLVRSTLGTVEEIRAVNFKVVLAVRKVLIRR